MPSKIYRVIKMTMISKDFAIEQFACKCGCGYDDISMDLVNRLQNARNIAHIPFVITSGCRCIKHNTKVGGKSDSAHINGLAADISYKTGYQLYRLLTGLIEAGFKRIGINLQKKFIHVDIDYNKPYPTVFKY